MCRNHPACDVDVFWVCPSQKSFLLVTWYPIKKKNKDEPLHILPHFSIMKTTHSPGTLEQRRTLHLATSCLHCTPTVHCTVFLQHCCKCQARLLDQPEPGQIDRSGSLLVISCTDRSSYWLSIIGKLVVDAPLQTRNRGLKARLFALIPENKVKLSANRDLLLPENCLLDLNLITYWEKGICLVCAVPWFPYNQ